MCKRESSCKTTTVTYRMYSWVHCYRNHCDYLYQFRIFIKLIKKLWQSSYCKVLYFHFSRQLSWLWLEAGLKWTVGLALCQGWCSLLRSHSCLNDNWSSGSYQLFPYKPILSWICFSEWTCSWWCHLIQSPIAAYWKLLEYCLSKLPFKRNVLLLAFIVIIKIGC